MKELAELVELFKKILAALNVLIDAINSSQKEEWWSRQEVSDYVGIDIRTLEGCPGFPKAKEISKTKRYNSLEIRKWVAIQKYA